MITRRLSAHCQSAEYRLMLANLSTMLPREKPSVSALFCCCFFKQSQENIVSAGVTGPPKTLGPQME